MKQNNDVCKYHRAYNRIALHDTALINHSGNNIHKNHATYCIIDPKHNIICSENVADLINTKMLHQVLMLNGSELGLEISIEGFPCGAVSYYVLKNTLG